MSTSMPETFCGPSEMNTQPPPSLMLPRFSILSYLLLLLLPLSLAALSSVPKCADLAALQCQLHA